MAGHYISKADIEARVSARVVRQVYDDDRTGAANAAAITQVIQDAESYVEEKLVAVYDVLEVRAAAPDAVKRLCLDAAVAYLRERWPSYTRQMTVKTWERLAKECSEVRLAVRRIDAGGSVAVPANEGGAVDPGVPEDVFQTGLVRLWDLGGTGWF